MSIVICTYCQACIYEQVKPLHVGDTIESSQFKGINGFDDPTDGALIQCPNCGEELRTALENATGHEVYP